MRLKDKVAIVTGGANGMGETHVRLFIEEGAKVVLTDIDEEKGQKLAEELGENALFVKHDVASEEDWATVVEETNKAFGAIHVLVNNAGIAPATTIEEMTLEDYHRVVNINQVSVFLGMKAVVPSMKKTDVASIVNVSSINGLVAGSIGYTDTKFAVRGMTKAAAIELAGYNIRVNSVHPGIIQTPMVEKSEAFAQIQEYAKMVPLQQRMSQPEEISQLVLFLASDDSSYSTGAEFVADGGLTAM